MRVRCPQHKTCKRQHAGMHCEIHEENGQCIFMCDMGDEKKNSICQPVELREIMKKVLERD